MKCNKEKMTISKMKKKSEEEGRKKIERRKLAKSAK